MAKSCGEKWQCCLYFPDSGFIFSLCDVQNENVYLPAVGGILYGTPPSSNSVIQEGFEEEEKLGLRASN